MIIETDIKILNRIQKDMPLEHDPYAVIANELNIDKVFLLSRLNALREQGVISRIGSVFNHEKAGASTLVAFSIPKDEVDTVAKSLNKFDSVSHNYLREHKFNLWVVLSCRNKKRLSEEISKIKSCFNYPILNLPMVRKFYIDLGFQL